MRVAVETTGLKEYEDFLRLAPKVVPEAARIAINDVAEGAAIKQARARVYAEAAFPKGYLDGPRLAVTKRARNADLQAEITGRARATSLARFAQPGQSPLSTRRTGGVRVTVNPGSAQTVGRSKPDSEGSPAFLVRLRAGATLTSDNFNLGLAIRLRPGEKVTGRLFAPRYRLSKEDDVFLLYAPSVDQVFADVAADIAPDVAEEVGVQFRRQFARLAGGAGG